MTLSRRCATAVAVVTVAGPITHSTCGYRSSSGAVHRHVPPPARTHRAARPPEFRVKSPGAWLRADADPARGGPAEACAEPVNPRERPGLRNTWTWPVHSPRVAR
ncbi:hypothetical protein B0I31_10347 [Saccharothrix carnea]|uniref:Uncharacterized protein n=1 Tax=Saccharothrix carnea TaxID=1280637 RepID=A0A2P8ICV2_SACCR|nr:hypothetical protein B0I31_10347 [Saccharothrix carnea]